MLFEDRIASRVFSPVILKENPMKKLWDTLSTLLVSLVVLLAVALVGLRVAGFQVFTVISGSMEPAYRLGDLIYVRQTDPETVEVGDPITFVLDRSGAVATHRVVDIDRENQLFYTKGDANNVADAAPVHYENLIGRPSFRIPLLGYLADFIQHPPGTYIAILAVTALVLSLFLPDLLRKPDEEDLP